MNAKLTISEESDASKEELSQDISGFIKTNKEERKEKEEVESDDTE